MEQWARDWLEEGRAKGVKRLEIKVKGKLLILDRGFFSEDVIKDLSEAKIDYVLPTRGS